MLLSTALGRVKATVTDLSQAGCRVRTRARCYRGDHFVLTIDHLGPRSVVAAWRGDGCVGLAFAEPLSWGIVMQIALPQAAAAEQHAERAFRLDN